MKDEKQMMKDDMVAKLAMYVCSNGAYGCDYRETKFVNLNRKRR